MPRGAIVIWKSSTFQGHLVFQNAYALSIEFSSLHNGAQWLLTNVYAPCTPVGKREFLSWFSEIQMPENVDWLIVGDFNLCRSLMTGTSQVAIILTCISSMKLLVLWV